MTPRPPDPPARTPGPTVSELEAPGPTRSRALDAAAASLKRDVGLCGDRCHSAAAHALDAAIAAAKRQP